MDLGPIKGDDLQSLHQGFVTDTINQALAVDGADTRLYAVDERERQKFVKAILTFLEKSSNGKMATAYKTHFSEYRMAADRWGKRIETVFADCFRDGYEEVLLIGSRTPTITSNMMTRALRMLKESDAVFGPTPEGRYYVIGMRGGPQIRLSDFDWKSASIYSEVAEAFAAKGLAWSELEIWYAVESQAELEIMVRDINQFRFENDEVTARETELVMERLLSKLGV